MKTYQLYTSKTKTYPFNTKTVARTTTTTTVTNAMAPMTSKATFIASKCDSSDVWFSVKFNHLSRSTSNDLCYA